MSTDVARPPIEIDRHTRAGHKRFKSTTTFKVRQFGKEVVLRWDEWMKWQATRDPLNDDPKAVSLFRTRVEKEMKAEREAEEQARRGPGISRRPRLVQPADHRRAEAKKDKA